MIPFRNIAWEDDHVILLDQTVLPQEEKYLHLESISEIGEAIRKLRIRGAPAIGIAAAYGLVLGAKQSQKKHLADFKSELKRMAASLIATRPTAINLKWAVDRLLARAMCCDSIEHILLELEREAKTIHEEDRELCQRIAERGADLIAQDSLTVLTHCNAGALATGGIGTALGIIYELKRRGCDVHVFADETRPLLQGARLTSWELQKARIPVTVICDNMAAYMMQQKKIDCVIVGADRIAANGDVANKIGTFSVALAAERFHLPFYVAAPYSSFDLRVKSGDHIPIEERSPHEIIRIAGHPVTPPGVATANPAFDITPNELITAIITDRGIVQKPFLQNIHLLTI